MGKNYIKKKQSWRNHVAEKRSEFISHFISFASMTTTSKWILLSLEIWSDNGWRRNRWKGNAEIISHGNEASLLQLKVMSVCRYVISDALRKKYWLFVKVLCQIYYWDSRCDWKSCEKLE